MLFVSHFSCVQKLPKINRNLAQRLMDAPKTKVKAKKVIQICFFFFLSKALSPSLRGLFDFA